MSDRRPIIHIGPTPFFANRGCHIRIRNEIEAIQALGRRVILCTYGHGGDVDGIEINRIWRIPGYRKTSVGFSIFKPVADVLLFFLVLRVALREKNCVLHGHLHEGGLIGWGVKTALFWLNIELLMDVQGSLSGELRAYGTFAGFPLILRFFYYLERFICLLPDAMVCSSASMKTVLIQACKVPREKVTMIGDIVPQSFFAPVDSDESRRRLGIPSDRKVVLYAGSLLPGKGVDTLLEAVKIVSGRRDDCVIVMAGYPKKWLAAEVELAGLNDAVLLPGEIDYDRLADWLASGDLGIDPKQPGAGEASGKILHYMAAGLAVACFAGENNAKVLGDEAFFASDDSADGLARAIDEALNDAERRSRFGSAGRTRARDLYSAAAVGRRLEALYRRREA